VLVFLAPHPHPHHHPFAHILQEEADVVVGVTALYVFFLDHAKRLLEEIP